MPSILAYRSILERCFPRRHRRGVPLCAATVFVFTVPFCTERRRSDVRPSYGGASERLDPQLSRLPRLLRVIAKSFCINVTETSLLVCGISHLLGCRVPNARPITCSCVELCVIMPSGRQGRVWRSAISGVAVVSLYVPRAAHLIIYPCNSSNTTLSQSVI